MRRNVARADADGPHAAHALAFDRAQALPAPDGQSSSPIWFRSRSGRDRCLQNHACVRSAAERGLIDRAAKSSGKTRTDFILNAARRAAEEELLDRTIFVVSPALYSKFLALLDAPPKPNARLRRTMQTPLPWSKA